MVAKGSPNFCVSSAWLAALNALKSIALPTYPLIQESLSSCMLEGFGTHLINSCNEKSENLSPEEVTKTTEKLQAMLGLHFMMKEYSSAYSIMRHYATTAQEVEKQVHQNVQMVVCGAEGGGLIYALAMKLRNTGDKSTMVIGTDFSCNPFGADLDPNEVHPPSWPRESYGENFPQECVDLNEVDAWFRVTNERAYNVTRRLIREEGLLVGPRSGAVMAAAFSSIKKYGENFPFPVKVNKFHNFNESELSYMIKMLSLHTAQRHSSYTI